MRGRVDRLRDAEPVPDDVRDHLHDRPAQADRAGAADDEPRPPVADDDRRRHHARQPAARLGRPGADEVVLAEHVVQLDAGARDDHARSRSPVDDESDAALPVRVDGRDVRRAPVRRVLGARRAATAVIRATARGDRARRRAAARRARRRRDPRRTCRRGHASARASPRSAPPAPPRVPGPPPRDAVEQREPVRDQHAARRRRRIRDHLVAEVATRAPARARSPRTPRGRRR